ncbi:MAG: UbiA family prenyltransferase [Planctomycetota bacterium]|nr:UbiA family prenyltransferase [Planctomycetota bacterium]MDG1985595.1 UbiA family prenyltransferase [Planctomycetota bacterium]
MATKTSSPDSLPVVSMGRLIRVALFPSAISDLFVGIALAHLSGWPKLALPWLLIPASLGIYHGAMALNDWVDRHDDARTRPERPIPSGEIPAPLALSISLILLIGGLMWATAAGPIAGAWMLGVAALAVLYDLAGRGPWLGPLLLGLCRAGNLGAGLMSPWLIGAVDRPRAELLWLAVLYGTHVFFISRLGRLEDDEDDAPLGDRPTRALRGVAITRLLIPVVGLAVLGVAEGTEGLSTALTLGLVLAAGLAARGAYLSLRTLQRGAQDGWTRGSVGQATGQSLRGLPTFTGAMASIGFFLGPTCPSALLWALGGAWLSGKLRARFPLT